MSILATSVVYRIILFLIIWDAQDLANDGPHARFEIYFQLNIGYAENSVNIQHTSTTHHCQADNMKSPQITVGLYSRETNQKQYFYGK